MEDYFDKDVKFHCPHCKSEGQYSGCQRVQGPDDLLYMENIDHIRELWQCGECDQYFIVIFELKDIIKLEEVK